MVGDANLQDAATWLGCTLSESSAQLQSQISMAVHTHPLMLRGRKIYVDALRHNSARFEASWNERFQRIHVLEQELVPFLKQGAAQKEDLEEDALGQLSFQHDLLKPLNHIPWMLALIAVFKVWMVPAMTVLFPLLAWIIPYILLKFIYTLPISQEQYFGILKSLWSGTLGSAMELGVDGLPKLPSFWNSKSLLQIALFGFSFFQSLIQPIQTAMHLHKTDCLFWKAGKQLIELRQHIEAFQKDIAAAKLPPFKICGGLDELDPLDYRRSFILVKEQPERLFITLKDLASLEILWRIARKVELQPTIFKRTEFKFRNLMDISIDTETVVRSGLELEFGKQAHAVITGPNGGGKSSFLRSILQAVLFGHTYGYVAAERSAMPRFLWIASGLQLRDTPGKFSMFETEVSYAAQCLRQAAAAAPQTPGLVLFDELFHSTNPPDGARTAQLFLSSLWNSKSTFSIVSTHVFPLVERAPTETVKAICCPATEKEGDVEYSYAVQPGICRVSSVKKVWEKFGLRAAK